MELYSVGEIIASRKLFLINNPQKEIVVLIGKPILFPNSTDYYCPFQIKGIGDENIRYAGGIDAVQALQLALRMIGVTLNNTQEAKDHNLRWEGDEKGDLGFVSS